jgi:hypothetical protein
VGEEQQEKSAEISSTILVTSAEGGGKGRLGRRNLGYVVKSISTERVQAAPW